MPTRPSRPSLCSMTVSSFPLSLANGAPSYLAGETDINSAFIQISLVLFPESIEGYDDAELRALLPVYLDSFFTLPVSRVDGRELTYEEVVKELDAETLSYSISLNAPLQEGVTVKIKVAKDKYEIAIGWLHSLLYHSRFSPERLKIAATKALQGLPSEKRDGSEVSYNAYRKMISKESRSVCDNDWSPAPALTAFLSCIAQTSPSTC